MPEQTPLHKKHDISRLNQAKTMMVAARVVPLRQGRLLYARMMCFRENHPCPVAHLTCRCIHVLRRHLWKNGASVCFSTRAYTLRRAGIRNVAEVNDAWEIREVIKLSPPNLILELLGQ